MHHLVSLLSTFSLQVKISYQIASECTIQIYCFQIVSASRSNYRIKQWQKASINVLIFTFQGEDCPTPPRPLSQYIYCFSHCSFKQFPIVSEYTRKRPRFIFFSALPNHLKYRYNACFRDIYRFHFFLGSSKSRHNACFRYIAFIYFFVVPNRIKYRHNACFRDIVFIFFLCSSKNRQNAPFTVLVFFFLCSSKSFQIPPECLPRDIASGSYTSCTSDLIIWQLCFVVRALFQTKARTG